MVPTTKGDGTGSVHNPTECSDIRNVCETTQKDPSSISQYPCVHQDPSTCKKANRDLVYTVHVPHVLVNYA